MTRSLGEDAAAGEPAVQRADPAKTSGDFLAQTGEKHGEKPSEAPLPEPPKEDVDPLPPAALHTMLKEPLDAEGAVRIAMLNNRDLRARLRALGIERGMMTQAGLLANPSLEAEISPERNTRIELRAEYNVMSFLLAPMRKKAAQHELDAARLDMAAEIIALGFAVRSAFYDLESAERSLHYALRALEALDAARATSEALLAAGNIAELDAATQIAAFERARVVVAKLELAAAEEREAMQRLLGLYGEDTTWKLAAAQTSMPDHPPLPADLEKRAIQANLDLRAAKKRLDAVAKHTGVARLEGLLPHLDVDVHSLVGNPDENGGRNNVRWGGGVGLDVPIFDRQQGLRRAREAEFDSWLERYQGIAIDVRSAARAVRARLVSSHRRALKYEQVIVPAQDRVMQQTQLQYNAMQVGVFQLLEARRAQIEVALDHIDTVRDYKRACAELDALLAGHAIDQDGTAHARTSARLSAGGH